MYSALQKFFYLTPPPTTLANIKITETNHFPIQNKTITRDLVFRQNVGKNLTFLVDMNFRLRTGPPPRPTLINWEQGSSDFIIVGYRCQIHRQTRSDRDTHKLSDTHRHAQTQTSIDSQTQTRTDSQTRTRIDS